MSVLLSFRRGYTKDFERSKELSLRNVLLLSSFSTLFFFFFFFFFFFEKGMDNFEHPVYK